MQVPILRSIGQIADTLGIEAHVVGGYVRDKLLGTEVNDIDIVVVGDGVAFAKEVAHRLQQDKVVTYDHYGTAMVQQGDAKVEFVGARKESYSRDSRKPSVTEGTLADDLARRDFTINAIAASLNKSNWGQITDPYDGRTALDAGILQTPLEPEKTFDDDPLRIMRAIRFAAQLGFEIEARTLQAIGAMKDRLSIISQERITDEFIKMMCSKTPSIGLKLMFNTGVMKIVFPEISELGGVDQRDDVHHKDVFLHTCTVVDNIAVVTDKPYLRLAALVHDIAKPKTKQFKEGTGWTFHGHEELGARMVKHFFRRMKLPMDQIPYMEKLVRLHLRPMALVDDGVTDSAVRRLLFETGEEVEDLMMLCRADITSKNPKLVKKYLANYDLVYAKMKEVEEKDRMRAFQSPVRGDEIMALCQLPPGKLVGVLKSKIEDAILDGLIPNEHDPALEYLMKVKDRVIEEYVKDDDA